ncbi:uncharacterized protein [Drosophila virilis]|uniref:Uncharacterized protein n=1 Tax=Drosophila virilis TaxID=7244 RepID=B4MC60_DROVI|nr:uncharacterized protein LOC6634966 [Drosophila virilis]EDW58681.1 uncharacterized protein Dvir_GJ14158 [Drosophila virilis]
MPSFIEVQPLAQPLTTLARRPPKSSPEVQSVKRKLFDCRPGNDIDAMLEAENKRTENYLNERYNISIKKLETDTTQIYIVKGIEMKKSITKVQKEPNFAAVAPKNGLKRIYRIRKGYSGASKVPKRKSNQISNKQTTTADSHNSEMGQ